RVFAADSAGEARVWDMASGRQLRSSRGVGPGEDRNLRGGAWCFTGASPDGRFALGSRPDAAVDVRSIESGAIIRTLPACKNGITSICVSADSRYALCGDEGGNISYFDVASGQCLFSIPVSPKAGAVDCVAFSADGKRAL